MARSDLRASAITLPYAPGTGIARLHPLRWFLLSLAAYALTIYGSRLSWRALLEPGNKSHAVVQARAWLSGRLELDVHLQDLSPVGDRLYSSFPPSATILVLVPVALFGDHVPDMPLHCLLAAASVAMMHLAMGRIARRASWALDADGLNWLTAFYAFGTILWVNVPWRGIWFLLHWLSLAGLTTSLALAADRRALASGIAWAFACGARPTMGGALPALLYLVLSDRMAAGTRTQALRRLAFFSVGPLVMAAFIAWLNWQQFGSPLDFGRSRMEVPAVYIPRLAQGVFSRVFFWENLHVFFLNPPAVRHVFPYLLSSTSGTGLFFTTPGFLCLITAIRRDRLLGAFWLGVLLTLAPLMFYYGHESTWLGARYLLDLYPLLFVLMAGGIGSPIRWWVKTILAVDLLYTIAWTWYANLRW